MGFGPFGGDKNKIAQTTYNAQAAAQTGNAYGAAIAHGNKSISTAAGGQSIQYGAISAKGGKGSSNVINITTPDAAAITLADHTVAYNASLSHDALEANQSLAALAISYANINAQGALQTLQALGTQSNVISAGGSAADVNGAAQSYFGDATQAGSGFFAPENRTKIAIAIAAALISGYILYRFKRHH